MKKVHVAIIDDGINSDYINMDLLNSIEIMDKRIGTENVVIKSDSMTHGTVCASIVLKYTQNITMSSVKILNDFEGNVVSLCVALDWCIENCVDIVNISLGSQSFRDVKHLRDKINEVSSKGIIIICATANNHFITYPAALSNVISVRCDKQNILNEGEYYFTNDVIRGIEIVAFSAHMIDGKTCKISNSFAAPMITAIVCNIMDGRKYSVEKIKQLLFLDNRKQKLQDYHLFYLRPDWIVSAIIVYVGENKCKSKAKYFFKFYEEIQICNDDLGDLEHKLDITNSFSVDTLIFVSEFCLSNDFKADVLKYEHNLVFIHSDDINPPADLNIFPENKVWNCELGRHLLNSTEKINKDIHEPIVLFEFGNEIDGFFITQEIQNLFNNDGINAHVITNNPCGVLYRFDFISVESKKTAKCKFNDYILNCIEKNQVDILLYSIFINNQDLLDEKFNEDIRIRVYMNNKYICEVESTSTQYKFVFDYIDCNFITQLYEHIISSFNV